MAIVTLGWSASAHAAPTVVQATPIAFIDDGATGSTSFVTTPTYDPQIPHVILIAAMGGNGVGFADDGCSYAVNTQAVPMTTSPVQGSSFRMRAAVGEYVISATMSGTVTVSATCNANSYVFVRAWEISGVLPGTLANAQTATGFASQATVSTTLDPYTDAMIVAILATDYAGTLTITPDAGWTEWAESESCLLHQCGSVVSRVPTSAGAISHTWTIAQGAYYSALIVVLPSAGIGGQTIARRLDWRDTQGPGENAETGFRVEKRTALSAPNWVSVATLPANTETYSTVIQTTEAPECWRVQAFNGAGDSAWLSACVPTPPPPGPCALPAPGTPITQPLVGPLAANPRYFTDSTGCPIYLTGSHTWWNIADPGSLTFDWSWYRNLLAAQQHNATVLWAWMTGTGTKLIPAPASIYGPDQWLDAAAPTPYGRSTTCCANDGGNKFDLATWDSTYWTRVNDRIHDLGNDGVYAVVMAFNRYEADNATFFDPSRSVWPYHPYHAANNINGLDGDANANGNGEELYDDPGNAVGARQKLYLEKLCDEICDEPNVLVEICNECAPPTTWTYAMIQHWQTYCLTKTYCPPIGMASGAPGFSLAQLQASPGRWYAPGVTTFDDTAEPYISDPPATTGQRVVILDSDHLSYNGFRDSAPLARQWVWKAFLRGYNPLLMEEAIAGASYPGFNSARAAMGHTRTYAGKIRLASMPPAGDLCSTTYCLAAPGLEYLVYQPQGGVFTVTVTAGTYKYEWFNPTTGLVERTGQVTLEVGVQPFVPPFAGEAVLWLSTTTGPPPPPPPRGLVIGAAPEDDDDLL